MLVNELQRLQAEVAEIRSLLRQQRGVIAER
jgi:hypothetical protein